MSEYRAWAIQLWDAIEKLQGDNLDYEGLVDGLATALQSGIDYICSDCEWYHNCDDCDVYEKVNEAGPPESHYSNWDR